MTEFLPVDDYGHMEDIRVMPSPVCEALRVIEVAISTDVSWKVFTRRSSV